MIDNLTAEALKEEFISLLRSTNRKNIENVIDWLDNKSDFFKAPSSTAYHGNHEYGLLMHSMNVYKIANEIYNSIIKIKPDTSVNHENIIIASLLHDICKCNFYKPKTKYRKDENGRWEEYQGYEIVDAFPYGHGEKSVLFLQMLGLEMDISEMLAIRWHMGAWDGSSLLNEAKFAYSAACEKYPLCPIIQAADNMASMILEETHN